MAAQTLDADVIVAGGGPAGSALAWELARRGVGVLVLDRERFPRDKVCGDYVEPRGLRILQQMGCLERLEASAPVPITHTATFVDWECCYAAKIPFYGVSENLPAHGYILPRTELDNAMLETAERAGARVHQETRVTAVTASSPAVVVEARRGTKLVRYRSRLIAGADGANSVVGTSTGALVDDERHTALGRRAYATGVDGDLGEASFYFDRDVFPGYGWLFPMADGRVNLGIGILSETRRRWDVNVPALFVNFVESLRRFDPRCVNLELCSGPIGGIVRTYGGAGPNHFDGGVLIGDAGSFVDPMTGEGITPAAESSLLAAPVLQAALEAGRYDVRQLSAYESAFRAYFDPGMTFLDLCAAVARNRNFVRPYLKALARGCDVAQADQAFARTVGSYFGGLDIQPFGILGHIWVQIVQDLMLAWPRLLEGRGGTRNPNATSVGDLIAWHVAWSQSIAADPLWHARWIMDVQRKAVRLVSTMRHVGSDPRIAGPVDG